MKMPKMKSASGGSMMMTNRSRTKPMPMQSTDMNFASHGKSMVQSLSAKKQMMKK